MRSMARWFAVLVMVAVAASVSGGAASAHESRVIGDGRYEVVVGFFDEPAFMGEKNGLSLRVGTLPVAGAATPVGEDGEAAEVANTPVLGLETTLQAEVIYGSERLALPLSTVYDDPGVYVSYFFPMAEGDYSFRITGTLEGVTIDETFTSGPETFSAVLPRVEFPAAVAVVPAAEEEAGLSAISAALALAGLAVGGVVYARRRSAA